MTYSKIHQRVKKVNFGNASELQGISGNTSDNKKWVMEIHQNIKPNLGIHQRDKINNTEIHLRVKGTKFGNGSELQGIFGNTLDNIKWGFQKYVRT